MALHSARYNGVAAQSILDRYALSALTAQQWFSNAAANYWAFTLQNNATDGTQLWLYDARARSSADSYPDGTGNPGGNPTPIIGGAGGPVPLNQFALISNSFAEVNTNVTIDVTAPAAIVQGNLLVAFIQTGNNDQKAVNPPSDAWTLLAGVNGSSQYPCLTIWGAIATGSEPGTYTWTLTGGVTSAINVAMAQFSGNATGSFIDAGLAQAFATPVDSFTAQGITTTQPGDLVIGIWGCNLTPGATFTIAPGFTPLTPRAGYAFQYVWGFATFPQGNTGDQAATNTTPTGYSAGLVSFKAGASGSAPGQTIQRPLQSLQAVLPGLMTVSFGPNPLAIPGLVKWLPPSCFYDWVREAPIVVVQPQQSFSLAGIAPEKAAWADMTWLSIGQT